MVGVRCRSLERVFCLVSDVVSVRGVVFFFCLASSYFSFFFFFNDTATTEIYTLSLHDALPISTLPIGYYFFIPTFTYTQLHGNCCKINRWLSSLNMYTEKMRVLLCIAITLFSMFMVFMYPYFI